MTEINSEKYKYILSAKDLKERYSYQTQDIKDFKNR